MEAETLWKKHNLIRSERIQIGLQKYTLRVIDLSMFFWVMFAVHYCLYNLPLPRALAIAFNPDVLLFSFVGWALVLPAAILAVFIELHMRQEVQNMSN